MQPFRIIEEKVPFGERVTIAITQFFVGIAAIITAIFLLPVMVVRTLFTATRRIVEINKEALPFAGGPPQTPPTLGGDDEDWKRAHREQYGDDD